MRWQGRRRRQRGSTLIEVSIAFIWVFTVAFGLAESARLMMAYTTLCDAARAGTRYAVVHGSYRLGTGTEGPSGPGNTANITAVVKQVTSAAGLNASKVTVTDSDSEPMYPDGTNKVGARVKIKVSYPFTSVLPILAPISVTIGSTSEGMICY
jgi:Flp pilus assembly protein TadG